MKAMILSESTTLAKNLNPLELRDIAILDIDENEILVKIFVSGICHTELDIIEARMPLLTYPIFPGHQVIDTVYKKGCSCEKI